MRTSDRHSRIMGVALAAALGLGAICAADAQDSAGVYAPQGGSDAAVAARVKNALQSSPTLDSRHIDVAVEHGEVHLKGFVQDNQTLLAARQLATQAAGDHKIVNELIIKQSPADAP